jgi:hypothetical protein
MSKPAKTNKSITNAASDYFKRGFNPVQLKPHAKIPVHDNGNFGAGQTRLK